MRRLLSCLGLLWPALTCAQVFNLFQPATGVLVGSATSYVTTAAASTDITALWSGTCNATTVLRGGGSCGTAIGQLASPLSPPYNAVGDGVANDTTAVQGCASSGACSLPAGYTFKVTSTVNVPAGGTFVGQGISVSIIKGSAVSGPVVAAGIGATATIANRNVTVGNFQISGTGTTGFSGSSWQSNYFNIWVNGTFTFNGFSFDNWIFGSHFEHLTTNESNIGSTLTFTASVGGATSGTIASGTNPGNGTYIMVFGNGEVRAVTVTGAAASWATALKAGTITTVAYGAGFFVGGAFNGNVCDELYTGSTEMPFNFIFDDVNNFGPSDSSTFNGLVAQNGQVGYFFGYDQSGHTLNAAYAEDVVTPIMYGLVAGTRHPQSITINGVTLGGPLAAHSKFANRYAWVDLQYGRGFKLNNPRFFVADGSSTIAYPLTFTGGTVVNAPAAYAFANAAGVIKGVAIIYGGKYTAGNPPTAVSYAGANPGTGATFSLTTGTIPIRGDLGVLTVSVTAGGSGYTASTGMVPVLVNQAQNVSVDTPSYGWGLANSSWGGISPIMAYSTTNPSGDAGIGITVTGEIGQYSSSGNGTQYPIMTVYKANDNTYQEWVQYPGTGGVLSTYAVPMWAFP